MGQRQMGTELASRETQCSSQDSEFTTLLEEVRAGSQDAAWKLVERYGRDVQRFVRRSLNHRLRSKFDSLDFVQIVWGSFFRAPERLQGIERAEQLVAYLATLAKFKVLTEVRRRLETEKYDIRREDVRDEPRGLPDMNVSNTPTPSSVAMAKERWEQLIAGEPEQVRQIVELRLRGITFNEIADHLHIHETTARKTIKRLLERAN
jgi:RNA polymerase sigma factor (sigma-70 family)